MNKHLGKQVENLTTDNAWGCTVRCVQMLIANALVKSNLPIPKCEYGEAARGLSEHQLRDEKKVK